MAGISVSICQLINLTLSFVSDRLMSVWPNSRNGTYPSILFHKMSLATAAKNRRSASIFCLRGVFTSLWAFFTSIIDNKRKEI